MLQPIQAFRELLELGDRLHAMFGLISQDDLIDDLTDVGVSYVSDELDVYSAGTRTATA